MKRFTGLLNRTKSSSSSDFLDNSAAVDSPQANAARSVCLFCQSASAENREEEVLHLPVIVEAAESSPSAANAAAQQIKRFLAKEYASKPYVQYNAIMLIRILVDNPGPTFTRSFDESFVKTVKELLKGCKDKSTQQILRETLDFLEVNKGYDDGLQGLLAMWRKQKGAQGSLSHSGSSRRGPSGSHRDSVQMGGAMGAMPPSDHRVFQRHQLPPAHELASRIEEARNTAKILLQLLGTTPPESLLSNELLREFSERCQSAQKSMTTYISCDSPAPDDDTMLTLIETNEQLSLASSRYQRAMLSARKTMGSSTSPNMEAMNDGYGAFSHPVAPGQTESLFTPTPPQRQNTDGFAPPPGPPPQQQSAPPSQQHPGPLPPQQYSGSFLQQRSGSPPEQHNYNGYDDDEEDLYQAPSGPPPGRAYQSQPTPTRQPQQPQTTYEPQANNPFLDPGEHSSNPAPLAIEPTNYGPNPPARKSLPPQPNHRPSISLSQHPISPISPASPLPHRPTGPYHTAGITPSYMGRQASASNGLTMHGATSDDDIPEIDGQSTVGRSGVGGGSGAGHDSRGSVGSGSGYQVSPVESRFGQRTGPGGAGGATERLDGVGRRVSRVDVPGTGGLRGA